MEIEEERRSIIGRSRTWWENLPRQSKKVWMILAGLTALIVGGTFCLPFYVLWRFANPEGAAQVGDMFGALNALFSAAALLGAVAAVLMQADELALQRRELKQSTEEFKRQNEIMDLQFKAAQAAYKATETRVRLENLPHFISGLTSRGAPDEREFTLQNVASTVYGVAITASGAALLSSSALLLWYGDGAEKKQTTIPFKIKGPGDLNEAVIHIEYRTRIGGRETTNIRFLPNGRAYQEFPEG